MQAKSGNKETFKWLSTHPPTAERIAHLEQIAPGLMSVYEKARAGGPGERVIGSRP
jgi:predicted Zn-dependent protease